MTPSLQCHQTPVHLHSATFFCLHAVESKNSEPPTEKEKNPKLLSIHTQPKARKLLQGIHSQLLLCVSGQITNWS
jgi:hypothetical protein